MFFFRKEIQPFFATLFLLPQVRWRNNKRICEALKTSWIDKGDSNLFYCPTFSYDSSSSCSCSVPGNDGRMLKTTAVHWQLLLHLHLLRHLHLLLHLLLWQRHFLCRPLRRSRARRQPAPHHKLALSTILLLLLLFHCHRPPELRKQLVLAEEVWPDVVPGEEPLPGVQRVQVHLQLLLLLPLLPPYAAAPAPLPGRLGHDLEAAEELLHLTAVLVPSVSHCSKLFVSFLLHLEKS